MQGALQDEAYPDRSGTEPGPGALRRLPPAKVAKVANLEIAPGVLHMWSTVLHTDIWVCSTEAWARVFRAEGAPAYGPVEIAHLGQLKARASEGFPAKLRVIHQIKQAFGAVIDTREHGKAPGVPPLFQTVSGTCYACGTMRRWRSVYGAVICATCHPPANAALVAGWLEESKQTILEADAANACLSNQRRRHEDTREEETQRRQKAPVSLAPQHLPT